MVPLPIATSRNDAGTRSFRHGSESPSAGCRRWSRRCRIDTSVSRARPSPFADQQSPVGVRKRSGQLRPYVRPVVRHLPLAIMGVRFRVRHQSSQRARGTCFFPVLPELGIWTAAYPITLFSASCRISRTCVRRLPSLARTSRRRTGRGGAPSFGVVDLFARHRRPCDARHLVRQSYSHQPERTAFLYRSGPSSNGAIPL